VEGVTVVCFSASYILALACEVWHQYQPRPVWQVVAWVATAAGLVAQTIYLAIQQPPLSGQAGWLFFIAWILAVFYLYGAIHHARRAWGIFVLPVLVGLVLLGAIFGRASPPEAGQATGLLRAQDAWGPIHAILLILATVGVCVGFVASVMYLVQMRRLQAKTPPGHGMRLLSLERLEAMNRRAINLAFPLLTAGVLVGLIQLLGRAPDRPATGWIDYRILSAGILWVAFALLWVLRYGYHLRGRTVAVLTIVAFLLLLGCLALSHPVGSGGTP
jgi:ABC-type transport system involved in cytochrome c biogenesis permease subunit